MKTSNNLPANRNTRQDTGNICFSPQNHGSRKLLDERASAQGAYSATKSKAAGTGHKEGVKICQVNIGSKSPNQKTLGMKRMQQSAEQYTENGSTQAFTSKSIKASEVPA